MAQSVFVMFDPKPLQTKKDHGCLTRKPQETSLDSAMFRSFLDDDHEAWMWADLHSRGMSHGTTFPTFDDLCLMALFSLSIQT